MAKYIPLDAVLAEIERRKHRNLLNEGAFEEDIDIISFINTLEVKEVDLDFQRFAKEMDEVFDLPSEVTTNTEEEPLNWEYAIAKHFFELGLKAQKGE